MQNSRLYALGAALFLVGLVILVIASAWVTTNPEVDRGILLLVAYTPVVAGITIFTLATYRFFRAVEGAIEIVKTLDKSRR